MSDTKHTPTPWSFQPYKSEYRGDREGFSIRALDGKVIAAARGSTRTEEEKEANAAFIVRACNAHEKLVSELRVALLRIEELESAANDPHFSIEERW